MPDAEKHHSYLTRHLQVACLWSLGSLWFGLVGVGLYTVLGPHGAAACFLPAVGLLTLQRWFNPVFLLALSAAAFWGAFSVLHFHWTLAVPAALLPFFALARRLSLGSVRRLATRWRGPTAA